MKQMRHSEAAPMNSTISAFSDDHGYVVVLLVRTELANFVHDRGQHRPWRQFSIPPHSIDQPFLPKIFSMLIEGVGHPVRVEHLSVSRKQLVLCHRAFAR